MVVLELQHLAIAPPLRQVSIKDVKQNRKGRKVYYNSGLGFSMYEDSAVPPHLLVP